MDKDNTQTNLADELESTGKILLEPLPEGIRIDFTRLRKLKDSKLREYVLQDTNKETRGLSFLLLIFLEDLFYNLSGDSPPYDENYGEILDEIRANFMRSIGRALCDLSKAVKERNGLTAFETLRSLANDYLDCIETINLEIGKWEKQGKG